MAQSRNSKVLRGRVLDSRPRGRGFESHRRHCVVSLSKNINHSLILVQTRKTCPFITEILLMGCKESNHKWKVTNQKAQVTSKYDQSTLINQPFSYIVILAGKNLVRSTIIPTRLKTCCLRHKSLKQTNQTQKHAPRLISHGLCTLWRLRPTKNQVA